MTALLVYLAMGTVWVIGYEQGARQGVPDSWIAFADIVCGALLWPYCLVRKFRNP
jgi:hypothetical protein